MANFETSARIQPQNMYKCMLLRCILWTLLDNNVYYISDHIAPCIALLVDWLLKAAQIIDKEA